MRSLLMKDNSKSGYTISRPSGRHSASRDLSNDTVDLRQNETTLWVQENCKQVSQELWQSSTFEQTTDSKEALLLYECGTKRQ